jgi:Domain of unknown function (DUF4282)
MSDYGTPPPSEPFGQPTPPPVPSGRGFFGALFDFKFEHFITPMIVKFVYVLALVALVIAWLVFLVAGFADSVTAGVLALVVGPVLLLLYLAFIRMTLEFYLAIVRMSQDIHTRLR